jgi:hypothetical protein
MPVGMNRTQVKIALTAAVVAAIALAAGLTVWLTSGGGTKASISHDAYLRLWAGAVPGETTTKVLDEWPKPPYQTYSDGFRNQCYEWLDKSIPLRSASLYNLCFKHGKLVSKSLA